MTLEEMTKEQLIEKCTALEVENADLEAENIGLINKNGELDSDNEDVIEENTKLVGENNAFRIRIGDLEEALHDTEYDLAMEKGRVEAYKYCFDKIASKVI